eukprot:5300228-Amphidinium_carterae.1
MTRFKREHERRPALMKMLHGEDRAVKIVGWCRSRLRVTWGHVMPGPTHHNSEGHCCVGSGPSTHQDLH